MAQVPLGGSPGPYTGPAKVKHNNLLCVLMSTHDLPQGRRRQSPRHESNHARFRVVQVTPESNHPPRSKANEGT